MVYDISARMESSEGMMMRSNYEAAIEAPNEINEETGVPDWWGSDEEAWGTMASSLR